MDQIQVVEQASLGLFDQPYIDLGYAEDISFDDAVSKAQAAKGVKSELVRGLHSSYRRYIAELSTCHAVERGGVAKFAKAAGLNYDNLRIWRSRYLPADQKRRYQRIASDATILAEEAIAEEQAEEPVPVMPQEAFYTDMFDGKRRDIHDTEPDEPDDLVVDNQNGDRMSKRRRPDMVEITVAYADGEHASIDWSVIERESQHKLGGINYVKAIIVRYSDGVMETIPLAV